jgi:hypothetical protein
MEVDDIPIDIDADADDELSDIEPEDLSKLNAVLGVWNTRVRFGLPGTIDFEPEWRELDRPRGIFTKRDREYLTLPSRFEGQTERDVRYRIRERLVNTFYDAAFLDTVSHDDLTSVFASIGPGSLLLSHNLLGFALKSLRVAVERETEFSDEYYETAIEDAIQSTEAKFLNNQDESADETKLGFDYTVVSISADIDVERKQFDGDQLREKILSGNANRGEFEEFWKHGSRRRLIAEANKRNLSEIAVTDEFGMESTYDIDQLENQISTDTGPTTVEDYFDAFARRREDQDDS